MEKNPISTLRERTCRECGAVFVGGPRAWYCPICRAERAKKASKEHKQRKRAGRTRLIGSIDLCVVCGKPYDVQGGLQKYCPDCAIEAIRAIDNEQGKAWIRENKETYYPAKNAARRRPPRYCRYCGSRLRSGISVCKSEECRRKLHIKLRKNSEQNRAKYVDKQLAEKLREERIKAGLTANEFYKPIGINAKSAQPWAWETGRRPIPKWVVKELEEKVGIKLKE